MLVSDTFGSALPDPHAYARIDDTIARGQIIASLSAADVWRFAKAYAAYLDTLLDGTNTRADARDLFVQMLVCAGAWRAQQQQRPVSCDMAAEIGN